MYCTRTSTAIRALRARLTRGANHWLGVNIGTEVVGCRLMLLGRLGRQPIWSAALGPAWMSEWRLRFLHPPCCVEVCGWWLWSLGCFGGRLVRNTILGPVCSVSRLYRFSASFSYKLANSFLLYQWKDKTFATLQKKLWSQILFFQFKPTYNPINLNHCNPLAIHRMQESRRQSNCS